MYGMSENDKYLEKIDKLILESESRIQKKKQDFFQSLRPGDLVEAIERIDPIYTYKGEREKFERVVHWPGLEKGDTAMYIGKKLTNETDLNGNRRFVSIWLIGDQVYECNPQCVRSLTVHNSTKPAKLHDSLQKVTKTGTHQ